MFSQYSTIPGNPIPTTRRRFHRSLGVLGLSLVTALGATACAGGGTPPADDDAPLQVWVRQVDDGLKVFEDLAASYEEETGQEVQIFSAVNDFEQRLLRAGAGNDLPDLFFNDNASSWQFVDEGIIEPIDPAEVPGGEEITDRAWDAVKSADGTYYGIPFSINIFLLYIRSDWREAVGLDVPEDWDDILELSQAFTTQDPDGDGSNNTFGFNVPASTERGYASWFWTTYLWQAGGDYLETHDDGTFSVAINEPEAVEALDWLRSLQCEYGVIQPNAVNTVTVDAIPNFTGGLTGMYQAGVQMFARYDVEPGADKYEAIAPPAGPDNATVMTESSNAYVVKGTDKREAAIDFAAYVASQEGQIQGMNAGGFGIVQIPVNSTVDAVEVYGDERWAIPTELYAENARFIPPVPNWTPFRQTSADMVNRALADCSADSQALLDELAVTFESELRAQGVLAE